MDVSDAKRLRSLEDENRKLKKLLAESMSGPGGAEGTPDKKMVGPAAKREAVAYEPGCCRDACGLDRGDRTPKRGFFDYSIACEIGNGGKRHLVIRAGKSHKFTISKEEVPR